MDGAVFSSPSSDIAYGFYEVAKYYTLPGLIWYTNDVLIQPAIWEKLPDNLKAILESAVFDWGNNMGRTLLYEDRAALQKMEDDWGVTILHLPDEDVAKARKMAVELMVELAGNDPEGLKALKIIQDYHKYLGRL